MTDIATSGLKRTTMVSNRSLSWTRKLPEVKILLQSTDKVSFYFLPHQPAFIYELRFRVIDGVEGNTLKLYYIEPASFAVWRIILDSVCSVTVVPMILIISLPVEDT